eukprot:983497_1
MASGWTDLLHGKASIYSLDPSTKQWSDSGGSGQLTMFQSDQYPQDVRLKWSKHSKAISWRLLNGVLKSKGERSWVLKGFNVLEHKDQILAIRFSDHTISDTFHSHYNSIFPPQNQQQMQIQRPQPQPYQPPPKTQPQRPVADWECAVCTFKNNKSKTICSMCGLSIDASFKASDKIKSKKSKKGSKQWTCGKCTFVNPSGKTCGVCGAKKPKRKASGANWICQMCTLQNDGKSTRCAACHAHPNAVNPIRFSQKGELNGNDGTDSATFEQAEGGFKDNDDGSDDVGLGYTNEGSQAKSSSDSMEQIYVKEEIKALEVNKMQSIEPNVTKQGDTDSGKKEEKTKGDEYYDEYLQRIYEKSRKYAGK